MSLVQRFSVAMASLLLGACVVTTGEDARSARPDPAPSPNQSSDQSGAWEKLGEKIVNGKNDHDDILVGTSEGRFRAIRLKVENSSLKMHDVVVEFTDGSKFSPETRLVFEEGVTSNVIDLPGGRRAIKRIGLRYSDSTGTGAARVEVWGR